MYFNAYLTNFTLEDPITKAGLEIKVNRKFYKLVPVDKKIKVAGRRAARPWTRRSRSTSGKELANLARAQVAATWSRSSWRSTARTTTSTSCSRT